MNLAIKQCKTGGQFVIPGLGKVVRANRKTRMGHNPQTGATIRLAPRPVVKFKLSRAFQDAVTSEVNPASADADEVFATLAKVFSRL